MLPFVAETLLSIDVIVRMGSTRFIAFRYAPLLIAILALAGCASEDPNIVNPQPGSAKVRVRMVNMVPDAKLRRLVMEKGFQTSAVALGGISTAVDAPADSSFIEVLANDSTELRTPERVRFARQSVYDIIAVGRPNGATGFDTIVVSNANQTLTTQPVAQVRVINAYPDTLSQFDVALGCPNGPSIVLAPIPFKQYSLYREVLPGQVVFSFRQNKSGNTDQLGTFECTLEQSTPYSIVIRQDQGSSNPVFELINEADLTDQAERALLPVTERSANIRLLNLSETTASLVLDKAGQTLTSNLPSRSIGPYSAVPTCEQLSADVLTVSLSNGKSITDSTSLVLRGSYTIVASDNHDSVSMTIVPPLPTLFDIAGKSIVRIVHASASLGKVVVSTGARTDAASPNNVVSGVVLAKDITYGKVSAPVVLSAGPLPITVSSTQFPTTLIDVRRAAVEPNASYLLVLSQTVDGLPTAYLIPDGGGQGAIQAMDDASLLTFVNASASTESITTSIGAEISNARVFFRNSLATSVDEGTVAVNAGTAQTTVDIQQGLRSLVVFTTRMGTETLFSITADHLRQTIGKSDRRVINATADLDAITVTYDTLYHLYPDSSEAIVRDLAFGQTSPTHVLQSDRRGSMYVYDATTRNLIYTLPITIGPLGNSYSLIVVGRKENGYEVIVLQEF